MPPTGPARDMGKGRANLQEHHDWSLKLWRRIDRDRSGTIMTKELDCEEFRDVLRAVITPTTASLGTGGSTYARVQQNVEQAVDFCMRKADFNHDSSLSFEEFKSFLLVLRSKQDSGFTANLIFALFDLDGDERISQSEFREIYRYYLGHLPTADEFITEWRRLDAEGCDLVTRSDYIKWLQSSADPIFRQHAPPLRGFSNDAIGTLGKISDGIGDRDESSGMSRTLPGLEDLNRSGFRAKWNQNFNTKKGSNHELPGNQRHLFSRPQSLPELTRYFTLHRGFSANTERMNTVPEQRRHKGILSTDSMPSMTPSRDVPGGNMRNPISGRRMMWNEHWQEPKAMKKKPLPVTLLFQSPGKPPPFLIALKEEDT